MTGLSSVWCNNVPLETSVGVHTQTLNLWCRSTYSLKAPLVWMYCYRHWTSDVLSSNFACKCLAVISLSKEKGMYSYGLLLANYWGLVRFSIIRIFLVYDHYNNCRVKWLSFYLMCVHMTIFKGRSKHPNFGGPSYSGVRVSNQGEKKKKKISCFFSSSPAQIYNVIILI